MKNKRKKKIKKMLAKARKHLDKIDTLVAESCARVARIQVMLDMCEEKEKENRAEEC